MAAGNERDRLSRRGERAHRIVPAASVYAPLAVRGAGAMTLKKKNRSTFPKLTFWWRDSQDSRQHIYRTVIKDRR